jgi:hypothetical protein
MAEVLPFREGILRIVPDWLRGENGAAFLYSIGLQLDGLTDALVAGVQLRFPGRYSEESLPLLGRQRRIRRGPDETSEAYATRLNRWLDDHKFRGGPYALLEQLRAFWGDTFDAELVYYSGRRFSMAVGGSISRDDIEWTFDANAAKWARWWLFIHWPESIAGDGAWDDPGTWDDGGVWDSTLTVQDVANLRSVPAEWNAQHAIGEVVLLSDGLELWDYPQGTWDEPGGIWGETGPAQLAIG